MNFSNPLLYKYDPTIGNDTLCANCGQRYGAHHGMVCHPGNKHSSLFAQIPKQEDTVKSAVYSGGFNLSAAAIAGLRKELAEALYGRAITAVVHDEVQVAEQQAQLAHDHSDAAFEEKMRQYLDARGLTVVSTTAVEDGLVQEQMTHDPVSGVIGYGDVFAKPGQPLPVRNTLFETPNNTPRGLTVMAGFGSHRMGMNAWQRKD